MLTNEDFINAGYTRYRPSPYNECVTDLFEKCVKDDYGKRYFIHVNRWDFTKYERNGRVNVNYESTVQLTLKDGCCINIDGLSIGTDWTIEKMEEFYAELWDTGKFKYYEAFDAYKNIIESEY